MAPEGGLVCRRCAKSFVSIGESLKALWLNDQLLTGVQPFSALRTVDWKTVVRRALAHQKWSLRDGLLQHDEFFHWRRA